METITDSKRGMNDFALLRSRDIEEQKQNISFFEYFYVLVLIIYGGLANTFVRSFSPEKPFAILLPVFLSLILALRSKIVFNKQIFLLLLFYLLYNFALALKFKSVYPIFFGQLLVSFSITYITIKSLRANFFILFESLIFYLTIVALGIWTVQLLMGGDNLFLLLGKIPSIDTFSAVTSRGLNIVIYSVQPVPPGTDSFIILPRNCGFAWEPGGFAVFLCLAILVNLFFIKHKGKVNKHFWVFLLGLLSTQSTTGYTIFIIIILFYYLQKNIKIIVLLFPVLIITLVALFSLPFMKDKIILYIDEVNKVDAIVEESVGSQTSRAPQRFASFIISFKDFVNNPLLGYGGQTEERWYSKINSNIAPISGIGNLLAEYGLTGFLFFIILLIKSSFFYAGFYNYNGRFLFLVVMLLITVSYSVILLPVIMVFWMYSLFENPLPDINDTYN